MSETSIAPQSIAADNETERKVRTFRVLKRDEEAAGVTRWIDLATPYTTRWNPDAGEVGGLFGEGDYLLIECDDKYDFRYVYPMRVVAETRYRLADDETA